MTSRLSRITYGVFSTALLLVAAAVIADEGVGEQAAINKPNLATEPPLQQSAQQLVIFDQTINFNLPANWKLAHSEQQATMFSAEFVPANQELQTWSSMVCVQGFKGVAEDIEPEVFLQTMANVYLESCQGDMVFESLPSEPLNGHETATAIIGCTKMPNSHLKSIDNTNAYEANHGLGEIGHYTAVKGKSDLYLIHKSMRGDNFTQANPPLKSQNYREFLSSITPLSVQ